MLKVLFGALLLLVAGCAPPAEQSAEPEQTAVPIAGQASKIGDWGVDLENRDTSVLPGDDFFRYANGSWLAGYELPADKSSYGSFMALHELSQERVQALIDGLSDGNPPVGSVAQKVRDYYLSFLDIKTLNGLGVEPIADELSRIGAIASIDELAAVFSDVDLSGSRAPIGLGIEIDRMNPQRWIVGISIGGLGMPDRDYYLEDTERFIELRSAYQAHIETLLSLVDYPGAAQAAAAVLALETAIAEIHWPRADRRNRDLTYNLQTSAQFMADHPGFPWQSFLLVDGDLPEALNVRFPSAMTPMLALINETDLATWRAYLSFHLVTGNAFALSAEIDDANFDFRGRTLSGQPEQRERWRRAISLVSGQSGLGDALGQLYVEQYFPPESKAMMNELVDNLRAALRERIDALDWMTDATKALAKDKLSGFIQNIGYPDNWRDYSDVSIAVDDLMGNVRSLRRFQRATAVARLGQPTDRREWFMPAQTVNAYYVPQFNSITFPAGILDAPFFDPAADPAVNYGAIGAVIGHEIGHGFDDQGSKSDARGVQRNWWTDEDRARFEARAQKLVAQYSAFEPVPGTPINGEVTLGENIGDLGGVNMAYYAYRLSLGGEEPPVIDGYTGDQRFFLAYAQIWQSKMRTETLLNRLKSGVHSPGEYRVNGVLRNVDAWYEAFDVGENAALYLPPEQRVSIW